MRKRCVACGLLEEAAANCTLSRCPGQFARTARQTLTAAEARAVRDHIKAQLRYLERRRIDPQWLAQEKRRKAIADRKYQSKPHVKRRRLDYYRKAKEKRRAKVLDYMREYNARPEVRARKAARDAERRSWGEMRLMDILKDRERRARKRIVARIEARGREAQTDAYGYAVAD